MASPTSVPGDKVAKNPKSSNSQVRTNKNEPSRGTHFKQQEWAPPRTIVGATVQIHPQFSADPRESRFLVVFKPAFVTMSGILLRACIKSSRARFPGPAGIVMWDLLPQSEHCSLRLPHRQLDPREYCNWIIHRPIRIIGHSFVFLLHPGIDVSRDELKIDWESNSPGLARSPPGGSEIISFTGLGPESTAVFWAAEHGWLEAVENLLTMDGVQVDDVDSTGRTILSWAAAAGKQKMIDLLLDKYASWLKDKQERSPLWWAAAAGNGAVVKAFLERPRVKEKIVSELIQNDYPTDASALSETCPITSACKGGHTEVMTVLVERAIRILPSSNPNTYMANPCSFSYWLRIAAAYGIVSVLEILSKSRFILQPDSDLNMPLYTAAACGQVDAVAFLLREGADRNSRNSRGETALFLAIKSGHSEVAALLINAGADIQLSGLSGVTPVELATKAGDMTILDILSRAGEEGALAERPEEVNEVVDRQFTATVVLFENTITAPDFHLISMNELLHKPSLPTVKPSESIRWIHLPANNMRWVELLMVRLYEKPTRAYEILAAERWVRRQHFGASGKPWARFMHPRCQMFGKADGSFEGDAQESEALSQDMVLFIPYLHWGFNQLEQQPSVGATKHEMLTREYVSNSHHSLHVRRTLGQYYHYHSDDVDTQKISQVASLFQKKKKISVRMISMVDQLWLWVIKGESGAPDIVISCFPQVGGDARKADHLDQYGRTDVLESIKKYLIRDASIITCAHDLAGLIAAKCSRIYLSTSTTLNFGGTYKGIHISEMYEDVIRDLMKNEGIAFEQFRSTLENERMNKEIAAITKELQWMSEAKLVLDELNIMKFLFETQQKEFRHLSDKVRPIDPRSIQSSGLPGTTSNKQDRPVSVDLHLLDLESGNVVIADPQGDAVGGAEASEGSPDVDGIQASADNAERNSSHLHGATTVAYRSRAKGIQSRTNLGSIWTQHGDGLLLSDLDRSIEDVKGMMDRANRAYKSLNALVDLKLKHNAVIDSTKALNLTEQTNALTKNIKQSTEQTQQSIEQTTRLAEKADKEGSTILVFTIVTIIFLPMSFMATMFQLNIRQYKKIDDQLDLGYVAVIIFPISIFISALLIWAALKASYVERILSRLYGRSEPRAVETAISTSFPASTLGSVPLQRQLKEA